MTEGIMGRGSDSRMYNPRSESSTMFRYNDGEDRYNPADPRFADAEKEKKQRDQERQAAKEKARKHIKITPSMLEGFDEPGEHEDEENKSQEKFDMDREMDAQTGPTGNLGALTSLATGARGPGFAYGHPVQMSEPMELAFLLLKSFSEGGADVAMMRPLSMRRKGSKKDEEGRTKEERKKWRPSTGTFDKPPGGMSGGVDATMRSYKAKRRGVTRGKKTGMMDAPLSVEMEHRGVAVKQPKSKDPGAYREYLGQQDAMKRQGNVRVTAATPQKLAPRKYDAGKTGGGRIQSLLPSERGKGAPKPKLKPHRAPPIVPPTISGAPKLNMGGSSMPFTPRMSAQSMVATSEDRHSGSELQKKAKWTERQELRLIAQSVKRLLEEKENKKKGMGEKDTSGGGSNLPKHPSNSKNQTSNPTGPTESKQEEDMPGADPVGIYTSRGGRTA
tara:strand:- start:1304 stop:2638 length:1335 start_codon:yes stop_codon:yes gene_type:complete